MVKWIKGIVGFVSFFGIILAYVNEANHLSGYFELGTLIKYGLLFGVIFGFILALILSRYGKDQDTKFSIFAGLLVLGFVLGPLVSSLINRATSAAPASIEFDLLSLEPVMESSIGIIKGETFKPDAHRIKIAKDGREFQLQIGADLDRYIIDDDSIILNCREGGLGYRYVDFTEQILNQQSI